MPVSLRSMQIVAHWFGDFPISHLLSVTFPAFSRFYSCGPLHPSSLILARCSGDLKREEEPCGGILDTVCDNSIQHTSKFEYPPTKMDSTSLPKNGVFTDWELKRKLVRVVSSTRGRPYTSLWKQPSFASNSIFGLIRDCLRKKNWGQLAIPTDTIRDE